MRILLFSRYSRLGASSRVRSFQYLPFLKSKQWRVDVSPLLSDSYLQAIYSGKFRGLHLFLGLCRRMWSLVQVWKYDLIWIEKELFPFAPALAEWVLVRVGIPYVVDYDDALFHRYDRHRYRLVRCILGRKIDKIMQRSTLVLAGNEYLAARARKAGAQRVEIIPTTVDLTRYDKVRSAGNDPLIVGWIGSPATSHYLSSIVDVYSAFEGNPGICFVAVGADEESLRKLPVESWPWTEDTEVKSIQAFDIGIMPLADSPWERGKCGYKLIQYMACGVPIVASPVGVNRQIVEHGVNGFLANDVNEWVKALLVLLKDNALRKKMGGRGRALVEKKFSLQVQAPRLESLLQASTQMANER